MKKQGELTRSVKRRSPGGKVLCTAMAVTILLTQTASATPWQKRRNQLIFDSEIGFLGNATLQFASDGGSFIRPITKRYGESISLESYIPTKYGYTFKGWFTDPRTKQNQVTTFKFTKTTIEIYLHSTDEMKKNAADKINARFGKDKTLDENIQANEEQKLQETKFEPTKGEIRRAGTGCISRINDHLYEGRYSPKNAYGKRMARNIYAPTREECEEKLTILIKEMKAEIAEQKAKLKNAQ